MVTTTSTTTAATSDTTPYENADGETKDTPIIETPTQSTDMKIRPFSVNLITYNLTTPVMEKTAYGLERMFVELTTTGKANSRSGKRTKYSSLTEEYTEIVLAKVCDPYTTCTTVHHCSYCSFSIPNMQYPFITLTPSPPLFPCFLSLFSVVIFVRAGGAGTQSDRIVDPYVSVQPRYGLLVDDVERRPGFVPLRTVHHRSVFRDCIR